MQEDIAIVDVETIREISAHNPSEYILEESTSWLSGDISSLASDDGISIDRSEVTTPLTTYQILWTIIYQMWILQKTKEHTVISQPRKKVQTQSMTLWKKQT